MFGFLGMFVAGALAYNGACADLIQKAIELSDPSSLEFTDDAMIAFGVRVSTAQIRAARDAFIISFGSCSFREPADELVALSLS